MMEKSHKKGSISPFIQGSQKPKLLCDQHIKSKNDFPRFLQIERVQVFKQEHDRKLKSICYLFAPDSRIHQAV